MSYKVEAVKELANKIKATGFRVFIAKSGTYGFYTDTAGSKVVYFQYDLGVLCVDSLVQSCRINHTRGEHLASNVKGFTL